jgi:hypothetical protein
VIKRRLKAMLVKAIMDPTNDRFYKSADELGAEDKKSNKKKNKKGSWGFHGSVGIAGVR